MAEYTLQRIGKIPPGEETEAYGHINARAYQQNQHDRPPYEPVNSTYKLIDLCHVHNHVPLVSRNCCDKQKIAALRLLKRLMLA